MDLPEIPALTLDGVDMQVLAVGKSDKRTIALLTQKSFDGGDVVCSNLTCCDLAWVLCSLPHTQDTVPPGCPNCRLGRSGNRVAIVALTYLAENTELYFEEQCTFLAQRSPSITGGTVTVGMSIDPTRSCAVYATRAIQKGELLCQRVARDESVSDPSCCVDIVKSTPNRAYIEGGNVVVDKGMSDGTMYVRVFAVRPMLPGDAVVPLRPAEGVRYRHQRTYPSMLLLHGEAECGSRGRFVRPFDSYDPERRSVMLADVPKKCRDWHAAHDENMSILKNCCLRHSLKAIGERPRFNTTTRFQRFVADLLFDLLPADMGLQPADLFG